MVNISPRKQSIDSEQELSFIITWHVLADLQYLYRGVFGTMSNIWDQAFWENG